MIESRVAFADLLCRRSAARLLVAAVLITGCVDREAPEPAGEDLQEQRNRDLAALRSHPYAGTLRVSDNELSFSGVVAYDTERAFPGLNLYTPRDAPSADLLQMDGTSAHRWAAPASDRQGPWQHVELTEDLDLLVIEKDRRLVRYDWDSNLLWTVAGRFHHDLDVAPTGEIYALSRTEEIVELAGRRLPVLTDHVLIVSGGGEVRSRISLLDYFASELSTSRLGEIEAWAAEDGVISRIEAAKKEIIIKFGTPGDLFHTNSIEILDRAIPGFGERGDLLVSMRTLDMIAVIDPNRARVRWSWGPGEVELQHHPTLLSNGNVLVFDNGTLRGYSRVIELDPLSREIVWEYKDPDFFLSPTRGSNQRLPNGNTLIVESDAGRAFEVDTNGGTVWEYFTPVLSKQKKKGRKRSTIYRMERLIESEMPDLWRRIEDNTVGARSTAAS
jgi:hypothetical protein